MKPVLLWGVGGLLALGVGAVSAKTCEEVKSEIEARIQANGVTDFELQIVDNDATEGRKIVGSCGGGTKKIVYLRIP